jgi:predicted permease
VANFLLIAICVLLGVLFRRLRVFPADTAVALNQFALYVSLPAVILLKVPQLTLSGEIFAVALLPWLMLLFSAGLVLGAARLWRWPRATTGVLLLVVPLGNTSFMGVPMIQAFFGAGGIPYLIVYDQIGTMLIFASYGSLILALYGRGGAADLVAVTRRALLFPPTIALLLGLALRAWPYPTALALVLEGIAATLTPLVMTAIGFQMTLRLRPTTLTPLGTGLVIKLLLAPLAALLLCRLAGLDGLAMDVAILEAGMPPMVTASALAVAAGMEAELAVALAGLGIVAAFATLPVLYAVLTLL